ncbi:hypothetical protein BG011_008312 [Mortierella polycephala]|uniref:Crinkler effector protein N-terminal domain-containing protein n=1 Tax=Mortierella polycephala TaxID=41804 RepID=A0A9P6TXQ0_9FUNG|nr:hypothetical protein BG011_008312 [Mortierella polycephala]
MTFFCLVNGESASKAFSVEISSTDTIDDLKDAIKVKKTPKLDDIAADELTLWSVSIPIIDADKHKTISLDVLNSKTKEELLPSDELSEVLDNNPPKKTIHIIFTWTVDANTATLEQLRLSVDSAFPGRLDGSETITIHHSSSPGDIRKPREPVAADDQLRQILWFNIHAGIHDLIVDMETQSRNVDSYTIADVNKLYAFASSHQPILSDLPSLTPMEHTPLNSDKRKRSLDQLSDELESRKKARHDLSDSNGLPNFTYSFLVRVAVLFENNLMIDEKKLIQEPRGKGLTDFSVMSKHDSSHILAVTQIKKNQGFEDGVAQNMVQLEEISRERGRKQGIDDLASYGIVTDAQEWHFVECKLDLTTVSTPKVRTSKVPMIVNFSSKEWKKETESIFGHIIRLLDQMIERTSDYTQSK